MNFSPRLVIITANTIAVKMTSLDSRTLPTAIIAFPLSNIDGNILTGQGLKAGTRPSVIKRVLVPSPSKK